MPRKKKVVNTSRDEKRIIAVLEDHLRESQILTKVDAYLIEQLAQSIALARWAQKQLAEKGAIMTYSSGAKQVSAEFTVWQKCVDQVNRLSREFGLSPKARRELGLDFQRNAIKDPLANASSDSIPSAGRD